MIGTTMIDIAGFWVWDSWYAEQDNQHHAFYLKAPRSLGDPDLRHRHATIGHSVSDDLIAWTVLPDALGPGADGAFDDLAVWTGSIVRHEGLWHMFYTGVERRTRTKIQRVGHATSQDLMRWDRASDTPVSTADARWYSTATAPPAFDEPWRDPWVFRSADDGLWHMLITAREPEVLGTAHGSIGHCVSSDLRTWQVVEPLSSKSGFRQVEVMQVLEVEGHHVLVFCAAASDVLADGVHALTGTFTAPADGALGPFHFDRAEPIHAPGIYAGRVLRKREGELVLLGFVDSNAEGEFSGVICDPIPLSLTDRGTVQPASTVAPVNSSIHNQKRGLT
jgi:beta-fructofuranosidase